ncbi:MAG: hypothetical protein ACM3PY_10045 [Omnitrophica WOR_2 bacterium]
MTLDFDDKGKIFTKIVTKTPNPITIQTLTHRIKGDVHVRPEIRLKDEINQADQFIAITDATVFDRDGQVLFDTDFLLINRDHVVWLMPNRDYRGDGEPEGEDK